MGLKLKTDRQVTLIVNSLKRVIKTGRIEQLTKSAYTFLSLQSGFIAHYSHNGFKDYYRDVDSLKIDIKGFGQWNSYTPSMNQYEYYQQQLSIYDKIKELC